MAIHKETPTRMHKRGETYVTIPSSTIAAIKNANALGILAYLLDKPPNWIPRKNDICNQLDIGPAAWKKATTHLTELGLYLVMDVRGENGQFVDKIVSVSAGIGLNADLPMQVNTADGKSAHIDITDKVNITDSLSKRFTPPTLEQLIAYQDEANITFDPEIFIDYWASIGWKRGRTQMKDWKATARNWARNENNANTKANTKSNQNTKRLSAGDRVRAKSAENKARYEREVGANMGCA